MEKYNFKRALNALKLFREDGDSMHVLSYNIYRNTIRIYINEFDSKTFKQGKLIYNTGVTALNIRIFAEMLEELADGDVGFKKAIELYSPTWRDNKRVVGEKTKTGRLVVTKQEDKDKNNICILGVATGKDASFAFAFKPSPYLKIYDGDNEITDASLLSKIIAKAYSKTLNDILSNMPEGYTDEDKNSNNKSSSGTISDIL